MTVLVDKPGKPGSVDRMMALKDVGLHSWRPEPLANSWYLGNIVLVSVYERRLLFSEIPVPGLNSDLHRYKY